VKTLEAIFELRPAFSEEQARALARLFDEQLATKEGLETTRLSLLAEVEKVRVEMRHDFEKLEASNKYSLEQLRISSERDIKSAETRIIMWVVAQGVAVVGLIVALQRLLP